MLASTSVPPTLCSERKKKKRALHKGWGTLIVVREREDGGRWGTRQFSAEAKWNPGAYSLTVADTSSGGHKIGASFTYYSEPFVYQF